MMISPAKQAVLELAAQLPEDCSWDEVMSRLYVRQKIQQGLADVEAGRLLSTDEVFAEYADGTSPDAVDQNITA